MEAIKTEYCGIVFDSKSEAVFARTLDLGQNTWGYHPAERGGRIWDFEVILNTGPHSSSLFWEHFKRLSYENQLYNFRGDAVVSIEYKPAMPTNTYVDNLTEIVRPHPFESIIVWGNPWDGIDKSISGPDGCCYHVYPIFSSRGKFGWGDFCRLAENGNDEPTSWAHDILTMFRITEDMAQEARRYRYDLAR